MCSHIGMLQEGLVNNNIVTKYHIEKKYNILDDTLKYIATKIWTMIM